MSGHFENIYVYINTFTHRQTNHNNNFRLLCMGGLATIILLGYKDPKLNYGLFYQNPARRSHKLWGFTRDARGKQSRESFPPSLTASPTSTTNNSELPLYNL